MFILLLTNTVFSVTLILFKYDTTGEDPGFLERGFICIEVWGFALLILSNIA